MVSVFDVAKYILQKQIETSVWKLHKLCYYCQAWHIAWTGHRLIREKFEAWSNGPVCPDLSYALGSKFTITPDDLPNGDADALSDDEKESVDVVLDAYGDKKPYELREMARSDDPWINAHAGFADGETCHNEIPVEAMESYYGELVGLR